MKFCFVGESRSKLAQKMGVYWKDGRLAAKQLFDALAACNIDPKDQLFFNADTRRVLSIREAAKSGYVVVGMGMIAQRRLNNWAIPHIKLIHPAARGKIRRKEVYIDHVRAILTATTTTDRHTPACADNIASQVAADSAPVNDSPPLP